MQASVCHLQGRPDSGGVVRAELASGYRRAYKQVGVSPQPLAPLQPASCARAHVCTMLSTVLPAVAIGVTVWCGLDPGDLWDDTGMYIREPCNASGLGQPLMAGLLVPGLFAIYALLASRDRLFKMVCRRRTRSTCTSTRTARTCRCR